MNCQLCQKESDAYRDGNLSADMRAQVEAHLGECEKCAESYKLLTLAYRVIKEERELLSNPFLSTRIMTRIENIETSGYKTVSTYNRILRPVIIATSLAAAIFFGVIMGNIYKPSSNDEAIPVELALINDATIESVDVLSNE